jgi:hypothetical protein
MPRTGAPRARFAAMSLAMCGLCFTLTATPAHADTASPAATADTSTLINPSSDGALINLLGHEGVKYEPVTTFAQAQALSGLDSTLVVNDNSLTAAELESLRNTQFARVILLEANSDALQKFTAGDVDSTQLAAKAVTTTDAQCGQTDAAASGAISYPTTVTTYQISGKSAIGCYPVGASPSLVYLPTTTGYTYDVIALGSGDFFNNATLATAGNAALALRVFGVNTKLVWLATSFTIDPAITNCGGCNTSPGPNNTTTTASPNPGGAAASHPTLESMLPSWIWWVLLQLAVAALLTAYWRGRRLGPVVTEDLPVTVRAAETVEGHARLYRRADAHGRAAELLRRATAGRLAAYFGIPATRAHADPSVLIGPVAAHLQTNPDLVRGLLAGPAPQSEAELVQLADHLDQLEQEVRSS